MINVIKSGNKWQIKNKDNIIEEFEIDTQMKWEDKLNFINEKIKKYEGR